MVKNLLSLFGLDGPLVCVLLEQNTRIDPLIRFNDHKCRETLFFKETFGLSIDPQNHCNQ